MGLFSLFCARADMMKLPLSAYLCVLWCELIWWSYPCQLICVSCDVSWYDEATRVSLFVYPALRADMMKQPLSAYLCKLWCELIWWSHPCQLICVSCYFSWYDEATPVSLFVYPVILADMMKLPLSAYLCVLWCELIWWSNPCQLICVSCDVSWYYDEATPVNLFV